MICSVLVPTRGRPARLVQTLASLHRTARHPDEIEVLLRIDDDDPATLDVVARLRDEWPQIAVTYLVGPRHNGYASIHAFYSELAERARGAWCFFVNDDALVAGSGWDAQLADLPTDGLIVQPEHYQLGESMYQHVEGGAFPFVPTRAWKRYGHDIIPDPVDTQLDQILRVQNGWKTHFLPGITVIHQRDAEDVLAAHRRI